MTGVETIVAGMDPATAESDFALFEACANQQQTAAREAYRQALRPPSVAESVGDGGWRFSAIANGGEAPVVSPAPPSVAASSVASSAATSRGPDVLPAAEMLQQYAQRRQQHEMPAEAAPTAQVPTSYAAMFRQMCANRGGGHRVGRYATDPSPAPVPKVDPTYHERRELAAKIDDLRSLGFCMPSAEELRSATLEDLQSEVKRRTTSVSTLSTVQSVISMVVSAAKWIELMNSVMGGMLPLENYAKQVEESSKTPRFKYAIYQLVLRYSKNRGSGPWREILIVLFLPVLQACAANVVVHLSKGRIPLSRSSISNGLGAFFGFATKRDQSDGGGVFVNEEEPPVDIEEAFPVSEPAAAPQEGYESDDSMDGPPPSLRGGGGNFIVAA